MKRNKKLYSSVVGFCLILCLLIQVGCGLTEIQKKNAANFSKATVALSQAASNELIAMRNGVIQMNTYGLAAVGEQDPLPGIDNIEQALTAEAVKTRIQAVEVLKTYGELLLSLVEETQEKELKDAADKFAASISGLPSDYKIDGLNADAIQMAVYQIGRLIVEAKKAKAVQQIVVEYKDIIDTLCDKLSNDFHIEEVDEEVGLLTQYQLTGNNVILKIQNAFLATNDILTRLELVEMYKKTQAHRNRVSAISKNISTAIGKMKTANAKLSKSLTAETKINMDSIKEYGNSVKEVIDFIKVLGKTVSTK